jgi:transcriptional regulator with XRE-family HTH domain
MPPSSQSFAVPTKGELIRTLRRERRLTQEQLASKAGISEWQLSRIECDKVAPQRETLEKLAPVLGVTVAYFDPQALAEVVAERATSPVTRSVVERVLAAQDRIATMSNGEVQVLFDLLDHLIDGGYR